MFLFDSVWVRIYELFDKAETEAIEAAVFGRVMSPAGVSIDVAKLPEELAQKLTDVLSEHNRAEAQRAGR